MMQSFTRSVISLAVAIGLAACSSNAGVPSANQTAPGAAGAADDAAAPNMSGEYSGTVAEGSGPRQHLASSLAQYRSALGGTLTLAVGSGSVRSAVTFAISNQTELHGTAAATVGSAVCVYSIHGSYDPAKHRVTASYEAFHGCSGAGGYLTMKQKCYYARKGAQADVGGLKMC